MRLLAYGWCAHGGELLFLFVLTGAVTLEGTALGRHRLQVDDSCVIPAGTDYLLEADAGAEMLEVMLPAELPGRQS
jgi:hypothetical protein